MAVMTTTGTPTTMGMMQVIMSHDTAPAGVGADEAVAMVVIGGWAGQ